MMPGRRSVRRALGCVAAMLAGAGPVAAAPLLDHDRPLAFVENQGQTDARVRFYAQGPRAMFHITTDEVRMSLLQHAGPSHTRGVVLGLRFLGGNPHVAIEGNRRTPGVFNYLHGNDPAGWHTSVPSYGEIVYRDLWPAIDLKLRDEHGSLKYEFVVRPGAKVSDIRMAYTGDESLSLVAGGAMQVGTALGALRDSAPVTYQDIAGKRSAVASRYAMQGKHGFGFVVTGAYDRTRALIIDPGLQYSTFLGGNSDDYATAIAVDASGNTYIVGTTQSPDFPTTAGAFDRTGAASNSLEAFVTKLNPTGSALVYSTYLGGSNFEWGRGLAVDAAGNVYVAGQTKSSDFPTTGGAFDRTFNVDTCPRCGIDQYDAFVTKLNASGSALVYSTFLGGFDIDDALGIAVDATGSAYVVGETGSANFPTTAGAFARTRSGEFDAFLTKLNPSGSALVFSTYLGGDLVDYAGRVAVDGAGSAYVLGTTRSTTFPTTAGAFDTTPNGQFDVFVTKFNAAGSALVYSTLLGGASSDGPGDLVVDGTGAAIVTGGTSSADFPTTAGAFQTVLRGGGDAFVTKLNPAGSALVYSTLFGGSDFDSASGLAVDSAGNTYIAGGTSSVDLPVTAGAVDATLNGGGDAMVASLDASGATLRYATYLGGANSDGASCIARDSSGALYVAGKTMSSDFPTTVGAFDRTFSGNTDIFWGDAFIAKLTIAP